MCSGEACALCGAGCSNTDPERPKCEHDVIERHQEKSIAALRVRDVSGTVLRVAQLVAALYVVTDGVYFGIDGVDPWDATRDARAYAGPHPVVAHPPCERWGRYWGGGPMLAGTKRQKKKGDDGGCFASAIAAVRKYGGVLEHPEASHAWLASWSSRAASRLRLGACGRLARLHVLRRAGSLRPPRSQGDVALRRRASCCAARVGVGIVGIACAHRRRLPFEGGTPQERASEAEGGCA